MNTDPQLERIAELGDDFVRRRKSGENLDLDAFVEQHQAIGAQLRDYVIAVEIMEEFKPDSVVSTTQNPIQHPSEFPVLPDYRIIRQIGLGGMGVVYEAEQLSLGRRIALKVLPSQLNNDLIAVQRFIREAKSAASLHHTNIVPVFDVGSEGQCHYYAMQYILGSSIRDVVMELNRRKDINDAQASDSNESLTTQIADALESATLVPDLTVQNNGSEADANRFHSTDGDLTKKVEWGVDSEKRKMDPQDASSTVVSHLGVETQVSHRKRKTKYFDSVAEIGIQVADALHYAHENKILHRDIKPANLLLDLKGNIWVADFGLAKFENDDLTRTGDFVGTLRYMSPERFEGRCSAQSDVYSLGMTLYELIALRPAFIADNQLSLLEEVRSAEAPPLNSLTPEIPADLNTIITKSIQKSPDQRYANALELAEDLRRFIDRRPIRAREVSSLERLSIWAKRNRTIATLLSLLAILLVATTIGSTIAAFKFYDMANRQTELANEAKKAEAKADKSAAEATRVANENEQNLYFADMRLGEEATRNPTGFLTARETLEKWEHNGRDLRGWEWYWLNNRVHRESDRIAGERMFDVIEMKDGEHIVYGHYGHIKIYNLKQKQVVRTIKSPFGTVSQVQLSHDEKYLAINSVYGPLTEFALLEFATGDVLEKKILGMYYSEIRFSPDDRYVWTTETKRVVGADGPTFIKSFDTQTKQWKTIPTKAVGDSPFEVNPAGTQLAITCEPGLVIYDTRSWEIIKRHKLPFPRFLAMSWNPKRPEIAFLDYSKGVYILYLAEDRHLHFPATDGEIWKCMSWNKEGSRVIVGNKDHSIVVLDPQTKKIMDRLDGNVEPVVALHCSPSSSRVYSVAFRSIRVWDLDRNLPVQTIDMNHRLVRSNSLTTRGRLSWHPAEGLVVHGSHSSLIIPYSNPDDAYDSSQLAYKKLRRVSVGRLAISPDNKKFAGYLNGFVKLGSSLEEIQSKGCKQFLSDPSPRNDPAALTWSPQSNELLIANGKLHIWPTDEPDPYELSGHDGSFFATCWTRSGEFFASTHTHGRLKVFSADTKQEFFQQPKKEQKNFVVSDLAVAFSPDGTKIASAGNLGVIRVFERESGKLLYELAGHTNKIWGLDWSPDGKRIATASEDKTVRIWDADKMKTALVLKFNASVEAVAWSPDSKFLAVTTTDNQLYIYDGTPRVYSELDTPE